MRQTVHQNSLDKLIDEGILPKDTIRFHLDLENQEAVVLRDEWYISREQYHRLLKILEETDLQ